MVPIPWRDPLEQSPGHFCEVLWPLLWLSQQGSDRVPSVTFEYSMRITSLHDISSMVFASRNHPTVCTFTAIKMFRMLFPSVVGTLGTVSVLEAVP
eukprot:868889-Amphidinium_carterae.4